MTTLPQTTNVRLPRPVQGQVQLPAVPGGMPGGLATQQAAAGNNEVWRIIRAHIWMIIIVVFILSPTLGYVANRLLAKYYPRFTAAGFIQVQPQVNAVQIVRDSQPAQMDPAATALETRTHAQVLKADSTITRVLTKENGEIRKTQWFRQFNNDINRAKLDFEDSLSVIPVQDTKLVKVEFTYSKPDDCKTIVQELVSSYLEDQKRQQTDTLLDRTSMLNNIKIRIEMRLRDIGTELREKQIKVSGDGGNVTFGSRIGVKEMELSRMVSDQVDAQLKFAKARSQFETAAAAVQQGQDPPGVERALQLTAPDLFQDQQQLRQYEIELALMTQQMGPDNPRVKQVESRCTMLRNSIQTRSDEARARARVMVLEEFQQAAKEAEQNHEALKAKVDNLKNDLGELTNSMMILLNLQEEQRGLIQQKKLINDQIESVMALSSSPAASKVLWMTMPEVPRNPSFPKLPLVMAVAVALGLLLSLAIAFLRETLDQSIRSPRDIARVGQMQLLGIIPEESDDPQAAGARLPVVIFDAPHSHMAESFRHVRTRLQHSASLDTTRSLMVTSPSPGDGKTTVACNLAAGLALNGRRILLVDANFRRPEVHKVFGLPNEQGFSDVLNAVAAFDEVIRETQVPNLAVMTAGPRPMNPTELFESQLLIDFIERALEEFDHVIFDGAPIMVVAEAQAMAPRVDGVISVVRAKTNNRGLLQRMRDELKRTRAEHLGVILNAVRAQGGGYYRRNIQTYYDYASNGHA